MPHEPYLVGIAGPSGAGKSFLASHVAQALQVAVLPLDRYYRDLSHLDLNLRAQSNFDEPSAIEHELLIAQIRQLALGEHVVVPAYDFSLHIRASENHRLAPAPFIVLEGLFTLYWPELRKLLGTTVYVEMNEDICLQRRLERDVRERGRTPQSVIQQFQETAAPMARKYVWPTRQYADLVLDGASPVEKSVTRVLDHVRQNVSWRGGKTLLTTPSAS
jgi:uridine kinase